MGKFGRMIGKLSFKIEDESIDLIPKMGDNDNLMKVQSEKSDEVRLVKIKEFCQGLMVRNYPEEPIDEINLYVEMNLNAFIKEILIAFKWTTRDKIDKVEEEQTKKLM
jgi:hypothetical protein